jgi:hypothetical protein
MNNLFKRHRWNSLIVLFGVVISSGLYGCTDDGNTRSSLHDSESTPVSTIDQSVNIVVNKCDTGFSCSCNGAFAGCFTDICACAAACGVFCSISDPSDSLLASGCVLETSNGQPAFSCTADPDAAE